MEIKNVFTDEALNKLVSYLVLAANQKNILNDTAVNTDKTFSSYYINTLLTKALQDANLYTDTVAGSLTHLVAKLTTTEPTVDNAEINVINLYSADGNPPYAQSLKISDTQLIDLGSTSVNLADYYTKTEVDSKIETEVEEAKTVLTEEIAKKIYIDDIIDDLTSGTTTKPLSANQGKKLKALIDALIDDTTASASSTYSSSKVDTMLSDYEPRVTGRTVYNDGTVLDAFVAEKDNMNKYYTWGFVLNNTVSDIFSVFPGITGWAMVQSARVYNDLIITVTDSWNAYKRYAVNVDFTNSTVTAKPIGLIDDSNVSSMGVYSSNNIASNYFYKNAKTVISDNDSRYCNTWYDSEVDVKYLKAQYFFVQYWWRRIPCVSDLGADGIYSIHCMLPWFSNADETTMDNYYQFLTFLTIKLDLNNNKVKCSSIVTYKDTGTGSFVVDIKSMDSTQLLSGFALYSVGIE